MNKWIAVFDKDQNLEVLRAPDGTAIKVYPDKNLIITPDGYTVQINLFPPEFIILDRLDDHNGREFYEKLKGGTTNGR